MTPFSRNRSVSPETELDGLEPEFLPQVLAFRIGDSHNCR